MFRNIINHWLTYQTIFFSVKQGPLMPSDCFFSDQTFKTFIIIATSSVSVTIVFIVMSLYQECYNLWFQSPHIQPVLNVFPTFQVTYDFMFYLKSKCLLFWKADLAGRPSRFNSYLDTSGRKLLASRYTKREWKDLQLWESNCTTPLLLPRGRWVKQP